VLEVGIMPQVPTTLALPHTWTLKWVYKELESATEKVHLDFFFLFFLLLRGRGVEVNVFLLPSFDMWKEEGKGMILFLNFVFSLWSG
jgi:hypothetical protein